MEKKTEKTRKNIFYKNNSKGGISLIVLVITIIVVIILAAAVIISLQNNNPMVEANKARINSDVANMQAIFTNTVGKVMAENQDVVTILGGQLNTTTSGNKKTTGEATYKIVGKDGIAVVEGKIIFGVGEKSGTTYYAGKELPLYSSDTKWYVDDQGLLSVEVGGVMYGEGSKVDNPPVEETEITITESDNPMILPIKLYTFDIQSVSSSGANVGTITKVKFIVTDKVAKNKERLRDISQAQDKSVMAWVEDKNRTLVIACKEKIIANPDSSQMFSHLHSLIGIENLNLLDTSNVTSMAYMFSSTALTEIDLSSFDTRNVTNMSDMFSSCSGLNNLDLSNFNTSNVNYMSSMFKYCSRLTVLNFGNNFNTGSVTNMSHMFARTALTEIDLSKFDTRNVTNMSYMFDGSKVINLDLSSFDTSNVTDMSDMFNEAHVVNIILGEKFDTKKVKTMICMFKSCSRLKSLGDNINLEISNSTDISGLFKDCRNLTTTINIKNSYLKNSDKAFYGAATISPAKITINYTAGTSSLVDGIIATKNNAYGNSNIVKGVQI